MGPVNKTEALERCEQLQAEHQDRGTHTWVPVPGHDGEWAVAKIHVPPGAAASGTETRSEAKPSADDPRTLPPWLDPPRGGLA
jgi:hypothetical protein